MALQVTRVEVELKEMIENMVSIVRAIGDPSFVDRVEIADWLQSQEVEYDCQELGSALTELVREGKLKIYMGTEDRVLFAPPGLCD